MSSSSSGYLGIRKDVSVKHLVSSFCVSRERDSKQHACMQSAFKIVFLMHKLCVLQCRSYGDLTSLNSDDYNSNHFQHVYVSNPVNIV